MKNWQTKALGDIAEVSAGNSAPQDEILFRDGTVPFFRTADAGRIRFGDIYESTDYLNGKGVKGLRRFPKGTILFPKSGASTFLNHRVMLGVEGCVSSHLATIVADETQTNHRFLLYFLSTISAQDLVQDHAYPSLNLPTIAGIKISCPPLSEQQSIVDLLDKAFASLATAKANTEKNLQNARALFESHLQSVFTQRGKGWVEKPFSELCDIKHGYPFEGEFFSDEGDYVLLTPGNFYEDGGYRDRGKKQKYYAGEIPYNYVLNKGDLLVAMTEQAVGLLGSPIIVPEPDKFLHNQRLGLVTKKPGVPWTNEFFFHVFNTQQVRKEIHASASGVKVRHTSPTKIGEVVIAFPTSIPEQTQIVSTLASLATETQRLQRIYGQKLAALEELKKSLLHQAFSGELTAKSSQPVVIQIPLFPSIPSPRNITPINLHAGVLAIGYQAYEQAGRQWRFQHVVAEKFSHMTEALIEIDLGRNPVQDHNGPDDFPHLHKVEHRARMANYFTFQDGKKGKIFVKGRGFESLVTKTRAALGELNQKLDDVIKLMLPLDMSQAEVFATVYAAWNNLLMDNQTPTDEQIVFAARDNWHPDKLKIPRENFLKTIAWIRKKNVCPQGKGKRVFPKSA